MDRIQKIAGNLVAGVGGLYYVVHNKTDIGIFCRKVFYGTQDLDELKDLFDEVKDGVKKINSIIEGFKSEDVEVSVIRKDDIFLSAEGAFVQGAVSVRVKHRYSGNDSLGVGLFTDYLNDNGIRVWVLLTMNR